MSKRTKSKYEQTSEEGRDTYIDRLLKSTVTSGVSQSAVELVEALKSVIRLQQEG
jgi:hypothetical protein